MRFSSFFLAASFLSFAFTGGDPADGLIIPGQQAGPIKLGYTTIEEARDTLGIKEPVRDYSGIVRRGRIRKPRLDGYKHKPLFRCEKGMQYEYALIDSSKGVSMRAAGKNLHVIKEVRLTAPCKWETMEGIGVGSSFEEVKSKLGIPEHEADTSGSVNAGHSISQWHELRYNNITFVSFHKMKEPGGCCVDLIIISGSQVSRPDTGPAYEARRPTICARPCKDCDK